MAKLTAAAINKERRQREAALPGVLNSQTAATVDDSPAIDPPKKPEPAAKEPEVVETPMPGEPSVEEAADAETPTKPDPESEEAPTDEAPTEPELETKPAARKNPAPRKKAAPAKKTPAKKTAAAEPEAEAAEPEERQAPPGQPAALWDTSGGVELPDGWAETAVSEVRRTLRTGGKRQRTNTLLNDTLYNACLEYLLAQAREGKEMSFGNLAEAALEQIPQDDAGLEKLIDEAPEEFFAANTMKPRSVLLLEATAREVSLLPRRLKPRGFLRHSGVCQAVLMLRLLNDLGVEVELQ